MRLVHLVCYKEPTLFKNAEYSLLPLKKTQSLRHKATVLRQKQRVRDQKRSVEARIYHINTEMASRKQDAGKKKTNDETPKKTPGSLSNQEKKDLLKKIKNLEDENQRLSLENVMLKNNFDLRTIMNALSQKGVKELDQTEIANDMVKMALQKADERHSAEKKDMEKKHEKEIKTLIQKLQGAGQQPTQSKAVDKEKDHANYIPEVERNQNTISITVNNPANISIQLRETTKEIEEDKSAKKALEAEKQKLEAELQKLQNENKEQKHSYEKNKDLIEKEKAALLVDKQKMDADITRLQDEIKALKQSKEKNKSLNENDNKALLAEKQKLEAEVQKLEAEVQKLQKENKEQKHSYEKSKDLIEKNQDTNSKPVNPNDIHVLLREATKEKDDAKSEKNALLEEKQKLEAEIQKLQNENKEQKISYEKTKDLMEKEKGDKLKMEADIKRLQDEIKALKQSEEKNKSLNEKFKKLEEVKDNLHKQVEALQKENNEVKYRLKESQSPSLSSVISANDNKTAQQLKVENERLLSRLSELAGAQMTHNNPNIADLSDGFRPTKLSEEYSQLYDNLWTDAFEEHSGKKEEEDVIKMLRKGLLGSYEFCENVCREFTVQLTNSSLALPNSKPKKGDIPIVYKKQLQDMKKSFGVFLRNDVKESYRKQNTIEGGDKTKNYIDACVELCWLMVIQEPPVVIETPASKDSAFDTNTYRTYTKTGTKVDFVVWPALRLHQGGPLLTKGVAQGKN